MNLSELLRTALHSLRINLIRSTLAILGVVVGVGAVIVLISMGQGVKTQISDQVRGMGTDLVIVRPGKEIAPEDQEISAQTSSMALAASTLSEKDAGTAREEKELVLAATGVIEQQARVESPKAMAVRVVAGDPDLGKVRDLEYTAVDKGWTHEGGARGDCAIGQAVKSALFEEKAGDREAIGKKLVIGNREFTVKAVMVPREKSLIADPNRQVVIGLEDARDLFGAPGTDRVLEVHVKAREASKVKETKAALKARLEKVHDESTPFYVSTQDDLVASFDKIFSILTALVFGVALVSLSESAIGVSNIMYIAVRERTREIGVRLAQGASTRAILMQFLLESVTLCVIGAAVGIPLGYGVSFLINRYSVLPALTPLWSVLVALTAGVVVGVAAGVYPAWKATKSDIAEVLRAE